MIDPRDRLIVALDVPTVAAADAYGLLDRRQYLAGAYGATVTRLSRIKELFADGTGQPRGAGHGDGRPLAERTRRLGRAHDADDCSAAHCGCGRDALRQPPSRCRKRRSGQNPRYIGR